MLAETSETPTEVRLELNARTAMAQQRLARQALAERENRYHMFTVRTIALRQTHARKPSLMERLNRAGI